LSTTVFNSFNTAVENKKRRKFVKMSAVRVKINDGKIRRFSQPEI